MMRSSFILGALLSFCAAIRCESTDTTIQSSTLHIITHHKSGTFVGEEFFHFVCQTPERNGSGYFSCQSQNVDYSKDGITAQLNLHPDDYFIHLIRHPLDMLISGYLYHRECSETWTRRSPTALNSTRRFPREFSLDNSYCGSLQKMNVSTGMRLELSRSLYSDDGIGKMVKDMIFLEKNMGSGHILQICLADYKELEERVLRFMQPWRSSSSTTALHDGEVDIVHTDTNHMTDRQEHFKILNSAFEVLQTGIPVELLVAFPCRSEYSVTDFKHVNDFLESKLAHIS